MKSFDEQLDQALADYLTAREADPLLMPLAFARSLSEDLRELFLVELEELAEIDRLALAPPRDLPRRFGQYRIVDQLGAGGMGTVYEAEDIETERRVALKVLHPGIANDTRVAERFAREAKIAASIDHPAIVSIYGVGEQDGYHYLTMGVIPGLSMARILAARRDELDRDHEFAASFLGDVRELASAFADAAEALDFAHQKNVVHRDIKPANLMVRPDHKVCILDFGLARVLESTGRSLTRTDEFVGTPMYMAPEQADGRRDIDCQSDVYSLGAVLYECLTGQTPFESGPLPRILDRIRHTDVPPPATVVPEIPSALNDIVVKALERDRDLRYATAADLADDLRRFVDGSRVQARRVGLRARVYRRLRRRPVFFGLACAAVLATALGFGIAYNEAAKRDRLAIGVELRTVADELAVAPEGILVCAGLAIKWYENFGLGYQLPLGEKISAPALAAVQRIERLHATYPNDVEVLRHLVRVYVDVGMLNSAKEAAAGLGDQPKDRALFALTQLFAGEFAVAGIAFDSLSSNSDPDTAYFCGVYHMVCHRYRAAATSFGTALDARGNGFSAEYAYFAHLMRGWCRSLPEMSDYRGAQDDLLRASALRPKYGTPRLLWAALRTLDPEVEAATDAVSEASKVLTSSDTPWLSVLTARLLLGLAESSADLPGPLSFNSELSPLVSLPVDEERCGALIGTAMALLTGLRDSGRGGFTVDVHLATAHALRREFEEALTITRSLRGRPGVSIHLPDLLEARIELAAGRTGLAGQALERALGHGVDQPQTWLCAADLAGMRGDSDGEVNALRRTAAVLSGNAVLLPRLRVRLARLLLAVGKASEAAQVLRDSTFGTVLSGNDGARTRAECAVLLVSALQRAGGTNVEIEQALVAAEVELSSHPDGSPLHSLLSHLAVVRSEMGGQANLAIARQHRERAQGSVAKSWWRALVYRDREWLAFTPEAATNALLRAYEVRPHIRVAEAIVVDANAPAHLDRTVLQASSRVAPRFAIVSRYSREDQGDSASTELARLRQEGAVGHDLERALLVLPTMVGQRTLLESVVTFAEHEGADRGCAPATVLKAVALLSLDRGNEVAALVETALVDDSQNVKLSYLLAIAHIQEQKPELARTTLEGRVSADTLSRLETRLGFRGGPARSWTGPRGAIVVRSLIQ